MVVYVIHMATARVEAEELILEKMHVTPVKGRE